MWEPTRSTSSWPSTPTSPSRLTPRPRASSRRFSSRWCPPSSSWPSSSTTCVACPIRTVAPCSSERRRRSPPRRSDQRSSSPTWPASTRPSRSSRRSATSCENPSATRRWARRFPMACCSSALRARARRSWPRPWRARRACRSSRSPAPTSSRCSWASAPRACVTSSSRPRSPPPASSSSTRSMRSAVSAAPVWAADMTSASRP